ncbi:hypothetical protein DID76_00260 [Candidatus Marinamargulisbacteria bacterium SCGC AG-414-C22]|nr:hypothetical protein DID76_00260 [Candidatus Marinamargulisbacteria bacterium SCGC AG-414-C22]
MDLTSNSLHRGSQYRLPKNNTNNVNPFDTIRLNTTSKLHFALSNPNYSQYTPYCRAAQQILGLSDTLFNKFDNHRSFKKIFSDGFFISNTNIKSIIQLLMGYIEDALKESHYDSTTLPKLTKTDKADLAKIVFSHWLKTKFDIVNYVKSHKIASSRKNRASRPTSPPVSPLLILLGSLCLSTTLPIVSGQMQTPTATSKALRGRNSSPLQNSSPDTPLTTIPDHSSKTSSLLGSIDTLSTELPIQEKTTRAGSSQLGIFIQKKPSYSTQAFDWLSRKVQYLFSFTPPEIEDISVHSASVDSSVDSFVKSEPSKSNNTKTNRRLDETPLSLPLPASDPSITPFDSEDSFKVVPAEKLPTNDTRYSQMVNPVYRFSEVWILTDTTLDPVICFSQDSVQHPFVNVTFTNRLLTLLNIATHSDSATPSSERWLSKPVIYTGSYIGHLDLYNSKTENWQSLPVTNAQINAVELFLKEVPVLFDITTRVPTDPAPVINYTDPIDDRHSDWSLGDKNKPGDFPFSTVLDTETLHKIDYFDYTLNKNNPDTFFQTILDRGNAIVSYVESSTLPSTNPLTLINHIFELKLIVRNRLLGTNDATGLSNELGVSTFMHKDTKDMTAEFTQLTRTNFLQKSDHMAQTTQQHIKNIRDLEELLKEAGFAVDQKADQLQEIFNTLKANLDASSVVKDASVSDYLNKKIQSFCLKTISLFDDVQQDFSIFILEGNQNTDSTQIISRFQNGLKELFEEYQTLKQSLTERGIKNILLSYVKDVEDAYVNLNRESYWDIFHRETHHLNYALELNTYFSLGKRLGIMDDTTSLGVNLTFSETKDTIESIDEHDLKKSLEHVKDKISLSLAPPDNVSSPTTNEFSLLLYFNGKPTLSSLEDYQSICGDGNDPNACNFRNVQDKFDPPFLGEITDLALERPNDFKRDLDKLIGQFNSQINSIQQLYHAKLTANVTSFNSLSGIEPFITHNGQNTILSDYLTPTTEELEKTPFNHLALPLNTPLTEYTQTLSKDFSIYFSFLTSLSTQFSIVDLSTPLPIPNLVLIDDTQLNHHLNRFDSLQKLVSQTNSEISQNFVGKTHLNNFNINVSDHLSDIKTELSNRQKAYEESRIIKILAVVATPFLLHLLINAPKYKHKIDQKRKLKKIKQQEKRKSQEIKQKVTNRQVSLEQIENIGVEELQKWYPNILFDCIINKNDIKIISYLLSKGFTLSHTIIAKNGKTEIPMSISKFKFPELPEDKYYFNPEKFLESLQETIQPKVLEPSTVRSYLYPKLPIDSDLKTDLLNRVEKLKDQYLTLFNDDDYIAEFQFREEDDEMIEIKHDVKTLVTEYFKLVTRLINQSDRELSEMESYLSQLEKICFFGLNEVEQDKKSYICNQIKLFLDPGQSSVCHDGRIERVDEIFSRLFQKNTDIKSILEHIKLSIQTPLLRNYEEKRRNMAGIVEHDRRIHRDHDIKRILAAFNLLQQPPRTTYSELASVSPLDKTNLLHASLKSILTCLTPKQFLDWQTDRVFSQEIDRIQLLLQERKDPMLDEVDTLLKDNKNGTKTQEIANIIYKTFSLINEDDIHLIFKLNDDIPTSLNYDFIKGLVDLESARKAINSRRLLSSGQCKNIVTCLRLLFLETDDYSEIETKGGSSIKDLELTSYAERFKFKKEETDILKRFLKTPKIDKRYSKEEDHQIQLYVVTQIINKDYRSRLDNIREALTNTLSQNRFILRADSDEDARGQLLKLLFCDFDDKRSKGSNPEQV